MHVGDASSRCFLRRNLRALRRFCFLSQLFGEPVHIHGMLVRLAAEFVSCQVVFFTMGDGRSRVRVGR